jgi:ssRNA-specific RNase YbeY (16S rRNA maturation enzyme)
MRVRYKTSVDPDVEYDEKKFREEIAIYLADPDGWSQLHTFVYAPRGPAKLIRLSSPATLKREGCMDAELSCADLNGNKIWLNADRWMHGSAASKLPLDRYRQYMVSHEMGHSLGYDHETCPGSGPAPVMMQQTLGIGRCTPNTRVFIQ